MLNKIAILSFICLATSCSLLTKTSRDDFPNNTPAEVKAANQCTHASLSGRAGCCSYHKGVCRCNSSTGMYQCCDGTDSPTCRCK